MDYHFLVMASKEERFYKALELIEKGYGIENACRKAGISTETFYKLKEKEPFATAFRNAREKGLERQPKGYPKGAEIRAEIYHEPGERTFRLPKGVFLTEEGRKGMDHARQQAFAFLSEIERHAEEMAKWTFFDWWRAPYVGEEIKQLAFELRRNLWEWDRCTDILIQSAEQIEIKPDIDELVKKTEAELTETAETLPETPDTLGETQGERETKEKGETKEEGDPGIPPPKTA